MSNKLIFTPKQQSLMLLLKQNRLHRLNLLEAVGTFGENLDFLDFMGDLDCGTTKRISVYDGR